MGRDSSYSAGIAFVLAILKLCFTKTLSQVGGTSYAALFPNLVYVFIAHIRSHFQFNNMPQQIGKCWKIK